MNALRLKLEVFAGVDVDEAAKELCHLSNRIGILCSAKFNEVELWARPGDDPEKLAASFHEQLQNKFTYKIAKGG